MNASAAVAAGPGSPLASLRAEIDRVLAPLVSGARRVALLDYPDFPNVGDSAIWLGQKAWLRRAGLRPVYSADRKHYSEARLRRKLGDGVILFSGGGNLGDLWEDHQRFRETVIAAFPDNPVVVLSQSVHFQRPETLERARRAFDAHPHLTLLLREQRSLGRARELFEASCALCPDMAFALDPLCRPGPRTCDVLELLRTDQEASGAPRSAGALDWVRDEPTALLRVQRALRARVARAGPREPLRGLLQATYDPVARQRLRRGAALLASAGRVVTDRLHAHVLCLLLGIPHELRDNSYGKNRAFFDTWTRDLEGVVWGG
jgi:pyruvyl transferase EpsO